VGCRVPLRIECRLALFRADDDGAVFALRPKLCERHHDRHLFALGFAGQLGGLYEHVSPATFWTVHAALVGLGGMFILAFGIGARRSVPAVAVLPVAVDDA
jgi:hypothetical protein